MRPAPRPSKCRAGCTLAVPQWPAGDLHAPCPGLRPRTSRLQEGFCPHGDQCLDVRLVQAVWPIVAASVDSSADMPFAPQSEDEDHGSVDAGLPVTFDPSTHNCPTSAVPGRSRGPTEFHRVDQSPHPSRLAWSVRWSVSKRHFRLTSRLWYQPFPTATSDRGLQRNSRRHMPNVSLPPHVPGMVWPVVLRRCAQVTQVVLRRLISCTGNGSRTGAT